MAIESPVCKGELLTIPVPGLHVKDPGAGEASRGVFGGFLNP